RQVQHVRDVLALVGDLQRLSIVTLAVARLAGHINRREKIHLDLQHAVALAFFAAPTLDVETEPARFVAAHLRGGEFGEQIADVVEHAGVGRRIATRRATDRRLVNDDDLVETFKTLERAMFAGPFLRAVKLAEQRALQNVADERALAGATHAGDAGEQAERNPHVYVLQIIFRTAENFEPAAFFRRHQALFWNGDVQFTRQVLAGE